MARGYIYEITDTPNLYPIRYMLPNDLYRHYGHEFDFIENLPDT